MPSKRLLVRQHRLKGASRTAWTWVAPAKFLDQFLVAVNDAQTALDPGFGVEIPSDACSSVQKQKRGSNLSFRMTLSFADNERDSSER